MIYSIYLNGWQRKVILNVKEFCEVEKHKNRMAELKEQRDRKEYERLKKKFEK